MQHPHGPLPSFLCLTLWGKLGLRHPSGRGAAFLIIIIRAGDQHHSTISIGFTTWIHYCINWLHYITSPLAVTAASLNFTTWLHYYISCLCHLDALLHQLDSLLGFSTTSNGFITWLYYYITCLQYLAKFYTNCLHHLASLLYHLPSPLVFTTTSIEGIHFSKKLNIKNFKIKTMIIKFLMEIHSGTK